MSRMLLMWIILTAVTVVFTYFVNRDTKFEIMNWVARIAAAGIVWALVFGAIIFLERI